MKQGNFTACHQTVNPDPYIEACQQETCLSTQGGDCALFCSAVAAYAQECNRLGVVIHWRRPGLCRKSLYFRLSTFIFGGKVVGKIHS